MRGSQRCKTYAYDERSQSRDKRISELGDVLARQRQTLKQLLGNQKKREREGMGVEKKKVEIQGQRSQMGKTINQKIYTEVTDIGNRMLSSARMSTRQEHRPYQKLPSVGQQVKSNKPYTRMNPYLKNHQVHFEQKSYLQQQQFQSTEKNLEYLKSSVYRQYLENITKDETGNEKVVKKMKQVRNHHAYIDSCKMVQPKPYYGRLKTPSPRKLKTFSPIKGRCNDHLIQPRFYDQKPLRQDQTINLDLKILEKELQRLNTPKGESKIRIMTHTPTMKELHGPENEMFTPKNMKYERKPLSQNMKIQSKTINFALENRNKDIQQWNHLDQMYMKQKDLRQLTQVLPKQLKEWNIQNLAQSMPKSAKKKKLKDIFNFKVEDYPQPCKPLQIKKVNIVKEQIKYCEMKERKQESKPCDFSFKLNQKGKQNQVSIGSLAEDSKNKQNSFTIDFKLDCPFTPKKLPEERVSSKPILSKKRKCGKTDEIDLKTYLKPAVNEYMQTYPKQNVFFGVQAAKDKLQHSESTSTITKSGSEHPQQLIAKSPNRFSVITPSRRKR